MVRLTMLGFTAIALSGLGVADVRAWAERRRLLDLPNARSSHSQPTPRSGGLPIVLVTLLGWFFFPWARPYPLTWPQLLAFGLFGLAIAGISLLDDVRTVDSRIRFLVHMISAAGLLVAFGYWDEITFPLLGSLQLGVLGCAIAFCWTVTLVNIYNFMDGIDGIAGGQAVVAGIGWMAAGWIVGSEVLLVLGILLAGSSLGFLFHNWAPARVFMGDVGSTFLGFCFAALPVIAYPINHRLPVLGVALVWPFLCDGIFTLLRRLSHGENIFQAHRSHLYQRLTIAGRSHQWVSIFYLVLATASSVVGLLWVAEVPLSHIWLAGVFCVVPFVLWGKTVLDEKTLTTARTAMTSDAKAVEDIGHTDYWPETESAPLSGSASPGIKQFGKQMVLVYLSLLAAFTVRFVVLFLEGKATTPHAEAMYLYFSALAVANSFIPMLGVGLLVFYAHEHLLGRFLPVPRIYGEFIAFTGFFGIMAGLAAITYHATTFPRQTWVFAWAFSLAACGCLHLAQVLSPRTRQKILYSRPSHCLIDGVIVAFCFALAYLLRFDGIPPSSYQTQFWLSLPYLVVIYLGLNAALKVYELVWRFTGLKEAVVLGIATSSSGLAALFIRVVLSPARPGLSVPYGVLVATPIFCYIGFLGARTTRRIQYNYLQKKQHPEIVRKPGSRRVLVVGAGNTGVQLVRELGGRSEFVPVGFLDDDVNKRGRMIAGIRVIGTTSEAAALAKARRAKEVILAMPTAPKSVIQRVVTDCEKSQLRTFTVPSLTEIMAGKVRIGQLRPVKMEDLLSRDSIEYHADEELMSKFRGRRIVVTGAAGSIGSELARQLRYFEPADLILIDKDESGLFEIALELREEYDGKVTEIIADIRNLGRVGRVFSRVKPDVIFHAAAYKHVPMMEIHPSEAVLNNVIGTRNLVELAQLCRVGSFVLISTDKAVNPTNIMGATKRLAEMVVQKAACQECASFCCVRFGNVLGSRASVVPLFQKRIAQGKSLQITHPDIRRYFMTIPEAVQLVIQAGSLGKQGEIFVLDMGNPVKIVDLAKDLIEQSGLVLGQDIDIEFTGLRPGEKLFEELLIGEENGVRDTKYPKIFTASAVPGVFDDLDAVLETLEKAASDEDVEAIYRILKSINIGYQGNVQPITAARS